MQGRAGQEQGRAGVVSVFCGLYQAEVGQGRVDQGRAGQGSRTSRTELGPASHQLA